MAAELDLDDVAAQSRKARRELDHLRDMLTAASDALDYLEGLTPQQAAALRKDAERYRWMAKEHGWWLLKHFQAVRPYVDAIEVIDESIDAAMSATPAVGAA